jgi:hypothetical protein
LTPRGAEAAIRPIRQGPGSIGFSCNAAIVVPDLLNAVRGAKGDGVLAASGNGTQQHFRSALGSLA